MNSKKLQINSKIPIIFLINQKSITTKHKFILIRKEIFFKIEIKKTLKVFLSFKTKEEVLDLLKIFKKTTHKVIPFVMIHLKKWNPFAIVIQQIQKYSALFFVLIVIFLRKIKITFQTLIIIQIWINNIFNNIFNSLKMCLLISRNSWNH